MSSLVLLAATVAASAGSSSKTADRCSSTSEIADPFRAICASARWIRTTPPDSTMNRLPDSFAATSKSIPS